MKALFIAFFVGACCFLSACKGYNNIEQRKETVAVNYGSHFWSTFYAAKKLSPQP